MPALADLLKLVHIGIAFALVTGGIGRWILLRRAARATVVEEAFSLSEAAGPFERMVIIGSQLVIVAGMATAWAQGYEWLGLTTLWMLISFLLVLSVLPWIPLVFIPRGREFGAAMAEARDAGTVTPRLQASFADPMVALARRYELAVLAVVVVLMVFKPTL